METMFMNTENSKTNQPHKFVVNLSQRLDVKSSDKKKKKKVQINMLLFKTYLLIARVKI